MEPGIFLGKLGDGEQLQASLGNCTFHQSREQRSSEWAEKFRVGRATSHQCPVSGCSQKHYQENWEDKAMGPQAPLLDKVTKL